MEVLTNKKSKIAPDTSLKTGDEVEKLVQEKPEI